MTDGAWPVGSGAWAEDCIDVDRVRAQLPALNLLTGESLAPGAAAEYGRGLRVADLLSQIPIGVWMWGR
jgi:hypothetical protein